LVKGCDRVLDLSDDRRLDALHRLIEDQELRSHTPQHTVHDGVTAGKHRTPIVGI
jgi:hypothetical protein